MMRCLPAVLVSLVLLHMLPAEGGDEAPRPAHKTDVVTIPTTWMSDLGAAREIAKACGKPLLVYVCPAAAGCPAARHMDATLFTAENVASISEDAVSVRVELENVTDDATAKALRDMALALHPAVVVLSPDGKLLHLQYAGLYPAFDERGKVLPGSWGAELTPAELLKVVERAEAREARASKLAAQDRNEARIELAAIRAAQGRPAEARQLLRAVADVEVHTVGGPALARLLVRASQNAKAAAIYEGLVAAHPEHLDGQTWQYEAAALRVDSADSVDRAVAARKTLAELATKAGSERVRVRSRLALAEQARATDDRPALTKLLDGLEAAAGRAETAPKAWTARMLFRLAGVEAMPDAKMLDRAERHYRMLIRSHPGSLEAQQVKHAMFGMLRQMRSMSSSSPGMSSPGMPLPGMPMPPTPPK